MNNLRVPDDMSSVDTFIALYEYARDNDRIDHKYSLHPGEKRDTHLTPWNAIQIFKSYCPSGVCSDVRGTSMGVDFRLSYPKLDASDYEHIYGQGTAQKAIDSYHKTMGKSETKEKYDLYGEPCTYFTRYWEYKTPENQRGDLNEIFNQCHSFSRIKKSVKRQPREDFIFDECRARFTKLEPPALRTSYDVSCQTALDKIKTLFNLQRKNEDIYIENLSICKQKRERDPLFSSQLCYNPRDEVSLGTAIELLESQIPKEMEAGLKTGAGLNALQWLPGNPFEA